jgi:hypothetical protein
MSDKYILRSGAIDAIKRNSGTLYTREAEFLLRKVILLLKNAPAADVSEVVHGRWLEEKRQTLLPVEYDDAGEPILHDYVVYRCYRCGRTCKQKEPYCHCGAKMEDGGNE